MSTPQGIKKSEFNATQTIDAASTFDFVTTNGENIKITVENLLAALGVTGTIVQDGDVLGVPVLDTQGAVNNIRNLEPGSGISAAVSAENGIALSLNLSNGDGGVDLIEDDTADDLVIRNVQAGGGIAITIDDDTKSLIFAATGATVATKTQIVASLADLPTASGGFIDLVDDVDYFFAQDISTPTPIRIQGKTSLRAASTRSVQVLYTGVGTGFTTTTGSSVKIQNLSFGAPSGTLFDADGGGTGTLQLVEINIIAGPNMGNIANMLIFRLQSVAFEGINTNGLTFSGAHSNLAIGTVIGFLNAGTWFDLGAATFSQISINNAIVQTSAAGTTFLAGAAASANINAGSVGKVTNCSILGSAATISGITVDDDRWAFLDVDGVQNTRPDALLSMQANATATVITVATTPVLIAGTWVVEEDSQFTCTAAGRMTYNGTNPIKVPLISSISLAPVSGGSTSLSVYWAKNGTVITNSKRTATASSGAPTSITAPWQLQLTNGDYVECFVANNDTTANVLVSSAIAEVD